MEQTDLTVLLRGGNFMSSTAGLVISISSGLETSPEKVYGPLSSSDCLSINVFEHACFEHPYGTSRLSLHNPDFIKKKKKKKPQKFN